MNHNIIIPTSLSPRPKPHEESAAIILSKYFNADVYFLETSNYETPDISIKGIKWEMKSPQGDGKNNIQKNIREASHQSCNIVIDLRRSKLHQPRAIGYIKQSLLNRPNTVKRLLIITKSNKVVAVK